MVEKKSPHEDTHEDTKKTPCKGIPIDLPGDQDESPLEIIPDEVAIAASITWQPQGEKRNGKEEGTKGKEDAAGAGILQGLKPVILPHQPSPEALKPPSKTIFSSYGPEELTSVLNNAERDEKGLVLCIETARQELRHLETESCRITGLIASENEKYQHAETELTKIITDILETIQQLLIQHQSPQNINALINEKHHLQLFRCGKFFTRLKYLLTFRWIRLRRLRKMFSVETSREVLIRFVKEAKESGEPITGITIAIEDIDFVSHNSSPGQKYRHEILSCANTLSFHKRAHEAVSAKIEILINFLKKHNAF